MNSVLRQKIDVLKRQLHQVIGRISLSLKVNKRPSSYPYITGDSFRSLAKHILDETGDFNPDIVEHRDIVFVGQSFFHSYFDTIHPKIKFPYILLVHNGDDPIDEKAINRLDAKIIHCFAQDVTFYHQKVTPIPIGIENKHFFINGLTYFYDRIIRDIKKTARERKNKIFYSFSVGTNPEERTKALNFLQSYPHSEKPSKFLTPMRHAKTLLTYKFVASPPGNSIESCRTWEALYLGVIPIVKNYIAMQHFKVIKLPIWVIDNWDELSTYDAQKLSAKYKVLMEPADLGPLYMDYWIDEIRNAQVK